MKTLFADRAFNSTHRLAAVNSINWARILAQTVYYFSSYFQLLRQLPPSTSPSSIELQYVVPTGNFGDILAGYYAKQMGLPTGKLVVATNENDILARFWKSGRYEKVDSSSQHVHANGGPVAPVDGSSDGKQATAEAGVKETHSPAMDIIVSSNFERLLWYLAYEDVEGEADPVQRRAEAGKVVDGWMKGLKTDGKVEMPVKVLESARRDFIAERISDPEVRIPLFRCFFF